MPIKFPPGQVQYQPGDKVTLTAEGTLHLYHKSVRDFYNQHGYVTVVNNPYPTGNVHVFGDRLVSTYCSINQRYFLPFRLNQNKASID